MATSSASVSPAKLGKSLGAGADPRGRSGCKAGAAFIFLHGFGDEPAGWFQALQPWREAAPKNWRWLHLRAPKLPQPAYDGESVPAWGQVYSEKCTVVGSDDHDGPDLNGFHAASVAAVHKEIDGLVEKGIAANKIIIAGFSQGAAVALETALTYPKRLAGCVSLSGWLTPKARSALKERKGDIAELPILLCHGTKDNMVGFDCAEAAQKNLNEAGVALRFEKLEGHGHTSCNSELRMVVEFVHAHLLSGDATKPPSIEEWEGEDEPDSDMESSEDGPNVIYVSKKVLEMIREQSEKGNKATKEQVMLLTDYNNFPDDEVLQPVVLDDVGEECESMEDLVAKLGPEKAAQAFLKAKPSELECMTGREFREADEEPEEDDQEEEEEEEEGAEESEEEEGEEAPAEGQPKAKKAKTA